MEPHIAVPRSGAWSKTSSVAGRSPGGREVRVPLAVARAQGPGPKVLVVAGVHGDETQGIAAAQGLIETIGADEVQGVLAVIPVANPMAYEVSARRSPADEIDLNRSFPGSASGSPTERLADHLWGIARQFDVVLSLHSWYSFGIVHPYVEFPTGDSEAALRSFDVAKSTGLQYLRVSDWHPGLLVATAVQAGIPAIEFELGGLGRVDPAIHTQYLEVVRRALAFIAVLPPVPGSPKDFQVVRHRFVGAPTGGFFLRRAHLGQAVETGDILGEILDPFGDVIDLIQADSPGVVAGYREHPAVNAGDQVLYLFLAANSA